jgi:hypothetical protein
MFMTSHMSKDPGWGAELEQLGTEGEGSIATDVKLSTRDVYCERLKPMSMIAMPVYARHATTKRAATANTIELRGNFYYLAPSHVFLDTSLTLVPDPRLMVSVLDLNFSAPLSAARLPCLVLVERQWYLMSPCARQCGGGGDGGACEDDHGDHGCRGHGDRRMYNGQGYKPCLRRHHLPVHNALAAHHGPTRRRETRLEVSTSQPHASGSWRMPHQWGKALPAWSTNPAWAN